MLFKQYFDINMKGLFIKIHVGIYKIKFLWYGLCLSGRVLFTNCQPLCLYIDYVFIIRLNKKIKLNFKSPFVIPYITQYFLPGQPTKPTLCICCNMNKGTYID